jgi:streptomycin 6-kinase
MVLDVPFRLMSTCRETKEARAWLHGLPASIRALEAKWSFTVGLPFEDASCAWVAPVELEDGSSAVLKIGIPHMEGEHESQGLCFWSGEPTVRFLQADEETGAMLLERCAPGTPLCTLPEFEQDKIIAGLLRRLWRKPSASYEFRPLSEMTRHWRTLTLRDIRKWPDAGLVQAGLELLDELSRPAAVEAFVLATDLHAGNVLRSEREPWLVIDPKPFVGDPCYDATQHLFNCRNRLLADSHGTIRRFADLLGVSCERVKLWMFARAAAEPRRRWDQDCMTFAKLLAP